MTRPRLPRAVRPKKLISGGQTGVDRAALDVAIEMGIPHGGWCPRGRRSERGRIPACYRLHETASSAYAERTERNVLDADATLILCRGRPQGGTGLTLRLAERHRKPALVIDLEQPPELAAVRIWLSDHGRGVLNVAGPRASQSPDIGEAAADYLRALFGKRRTKRTG